MSAIASKTQETSSHSLPYKGDLLMHKHHRWDKNFEKFKARVIQFFQAYSTGLSLEETQKGWRAICSRFFTFSLIANRTQAGDLEIDPEIKKLAAVRQRMVAQWFRETLSTTPPSFAEFLQNTQPYTYLQPSQPVQDSSTDTLNIVTANVICFPGKLSYFYGGISPLKDRIDRLVETLKQTNAHILCLQEVWEVEAAQELASRLQPEYPYIVYDIGSRYHTLNPEEFGYSSGIQVLSKIPFREIVFTPFTLCNPDPAKGGAQRGVLKVTFSFNEREIVLLTSHFQHCSLEPFQKIRENHMTACLEIFSDPKYGSALKILAGDLNILAFSEEYKRTILPHFHVSPDLQRHSEITCANKTCTDYMNIAIKTPFEKRHTLSASNQEFHEWLDYILFSKDVSLDGLEIEQTLIPLFDDLAPSKALSDHQALRAEIKFLASVKP